MGPHSPLLRLELREEPGFAEGLVPVDLSSLFASVVGSDEPFNEAKYTLRSLLSTRSITEWLGLSDASTRAYDHRMAYGERSRPSTLHVSTSGLFLSDVTQTTVPRTKGLLLDVPASFQHARRQRLRSIKPAYPGYLRAGTDVGLSEYTFRSVSFVLLPHETTCSNAVGASVAAQRTAVVWVGAQQHLDGMRNPKPASLLQRVCTGEVVGPARQSGTSDPDPTLWPRNSGLPMIVYS